MANPLGNRLALHIMRDLFGEVAENVCTTLMQHGEATLDEILSKTMPVEKNKIQRIIYVLLKQRCIRFSSNQVKGKQETKYTFHSSDVFKFMRQPIILKNLNSGLEINERKMLVYLLLHGSVSCQRNSTVFASLKKSIDEISINKHLEDMASKTIIFPSFPTTNGTQYKVWYINNDKSFVTESCISNCLKPQITEALDENKIEMDRTIKHKNVHLSPKFTRTFESDKRMIQIVIESVVHQRFGLLAKRIFRLLFVNRRLDQKEISEMAMLPIKQTREILYKLFKSEYIKIQEVSRTSDHAPSRTLYFWYVDLDCIRHKICQNCFQAYLNISKILSKKYANVERGSNMSSEEILFQYCSDRGRMIQGASFSIKYLARIASLFAAMDLIMDNEKC